MNFTPHPWWLGTGLTTLPVRPRLLVVRPQVVEQLVDDHFFEAAVRPQVEDVDERVGNESEGGVTAFVARGTVYADVPVPKKSVWYVGTNVVYHSFHVKALRITVDVLPSFLAGPPPEGDAGVLSDVCHGLGDDPAAPGGDALAVDLVDHLVAPPALAVSGHVQLGLPGRGVVVQRSPARPAPARRDGQRRRRVHRTTCNLVLLELQHIELHETPIIVKQKGCFIPKIAPIGERKRISAKQSFAMARCLCRALEWMFYVRLIFFFQTVIVDACSSLERGQYYFDNRRETGTCQICRC